MAKVLLISNTDWYLYHFRLSLARYLRAKGMDVVLASPDGPYVSKIRADDFRWVEWRVGRKSLNPIGELISVLNLIRIYHAEKPLLVHLHTIKPVLYGSIAAKFMPVPAVVRSITGRGYVFLGKDLQAKLLRPLVRAIYHYALRADNNATIFENETDRQYFLNENLVDRKNSYIINGVGVDTQFFYPLPEPEGIPVVILAGRMLWDKGVGTFVDAARLLHSKITARFVLVGKPDEGNPANIDYEILKHWVDEGIIEWWGWQDDMRSIFASCHLVVLPSLGEGVPTILLEAAASGRAIVATDVPGCRDVVVNGITGLLVSPQDPASLAKTLENLITNPNIRRSMGSAGRKMIEQRFSTVLINRETFQIYQSLISAIK